MICESKLQSEATDRQVKVAFGQIARLLALRADSDTSQAVDISTLWDKLASQRYRIADCFFTEHACLTALEPSARRARDPRLSAGKLRVLERILLEGGQKQVAAALGLAPSTVAITAGNCLRAMGVRSGASRAPFSLTQAAHAVHNATPFRSARLSYLNYGGRAYAIVGSPRPDVQLARLLSQAEFAVTRLLIEGQSHAEIAAARRTSLRTVANQLAAAFDKLGVSGRCELLCGLFTGELCGPSTALRAVASRAG